MSAVTPELAHPRFTVQCCGACPLRSEAVAAVVPLFELNRHGLSKREIEVMRLIADGLLNKQIAARLQLAEQTVKFHVTSITRKLRLFNRTEVAVWAVRNGLA